MSTASQVSPNQSFIDSKAIVEALRANPFVKEVISPEAYHYTVVLAIGEEAVQVLTDYLSDSGFLRITFPPNSGPEAPTLYIYSPDGNAKRIQAELNRAFGKVSQFLEYQELKKEYASGQVPRHLSQWLLEGGF